MGILSVRGAGIGPFERFELDLSDGNGNPHPGPHILAGVNGAGKTTLLKAIAWGLRTASTECALPPEWHHLLADHAHSVIALETRIAGTAYSGGAFQTSALDSRGPFSPPPEIEWATGTAYAQLTWEKSSPREVYWFRGTDRYFNSGRLLSVAYASNRRLADLPGAQISNLALASGLRSSFGFENTIDPTQLRDWLMTLFFNRFLARDQHQDASPHDSAIDSFRKALSMILGEGYDIEIVQGPELRLTRHGVSRNFSQLPDGVRNTLAWLVDFCWRRETNSWAPEAEKTRPSILMIDEVDSHLHPKWQRNILPAIKEVFPDVQVIVTSHSPFVISSCPGAKVHVLNLGDDGKASIAPPVDAPFGSSLLATLRDIFGVESRWDVKTERELEEWNTLQRAKAARQATPQQLARLEELTQELSTRNEELRTLVGSPPRLSRQMLDYLAS